MTAHETGVDIADFCRQVEEHLARVNDGHLIRVVGPAFELVRSWAIEGVPLSIVCQGINLKAERHRAGRSRRPLRLEFCEVDVREVFAQWRRAVGVMAAGAAESEPQAETAENKRRQPSLVRHLERAIDRLARASGQLDRSEPYRDAVGRVLDELSGLRDAAKAARGAAREPVVTRLPDLDTTMLQAARVEVGEAGILRLRQEAAAELAAYRARLTSEAWARSVDLSIDRLLRADLGLPVLTLDGAP